MSNFYHCDKCGCMMRCVEFGMCGQVKGFLPLGCKDAGHKLLIRVQMNGKIYRVWWDRQRQMAYVYTGEAELPEFPITPKEATAEPDFMFAADTPEDIALNLKDIDPSSQAKAKDKYIPKDQMVDKAIYVCDARNFSIGIWHDGAMYGIREKFADHFVDRELHYDDGAPNGTCKPLVRLSEPLDRLNDGDFGAWRGNIVMHDILDAVEKVIYGLNRMSDEDKARCIRFARDRT